MNDDDIPEQAERLLSEAASESVLKNDVEVMELWIVSTLTAAMQHAEKYTEKVSAATAAIKYLMVKSKIPVEYGAGFGE